MDMTTYYGMDSNPFEKDIDTTKLYASNDLKQMTNRLEFIIRSRGIGVFMSNPGMGENNLFTKDASITKSESIYHHLYLSNHDHSDGFFIACLMRSWDWKQPIKNHAYLLRYRKS